MSTTHDPFGENRGFYVLVAESLTLTGTEMGASPQVISLTLRLDYFLGGRSVVSSANSTSSILHILFYLLCVLLSVVMPLSPVVMVYKESTGER